MPRGPPTLLSTAIFTKLFHQNPEHPRIRKHRACVQVIHYYLFHSYSASTKHNLSPNRTPSQVKILCDSYNFNYLNRHTDSKISALCIWRIIYRRLNPHTDSINLNPSHAVIYIQQQNLSTDEINLSVPKRKQAMCHNQRCWFSYHQKQYLHYSTKRYTSSLHVYQSSLSSSRAT